MKWISTARGRIVVGSIIVHIFLAIMILGLIYWAIRPILFPSDPLAPRYFLSYYMRLYGWVLTAFFTILSVLYQILLIKWILRFVNASPSGLYYLFVVLTLICIFSGVIWAQVLGDFAFSHFLVFAVGFLAPGLWPSYIVVLRWENQHQQTLIIHGFTFKTALE